MSKTIFIQRTADALDEIIFAEEKKKKGKGMAAIKSF